MADFTSYCDYVASEGAKQIHIDYHDQEYGFPIEDDNLLFERMCLELNQAGLSWELILKRRDGFRRAFDQFDIQKVAAYSDAKVEELLLNPEIIRNRMKVNAMIHNANRVIQIQKEHGSFKNWIDSHHPKTKEEWVKLFRKEFKFMGGEIVNEFLMSTGYLPGAHVETCPVFLEIKKQNPAWMR